MDLQSLDINYYIMVNTEKDLSKPDGTTLLMVNKAIDKRWIGNIDSKIQEVIDEQKIEIEKIRKDSIGMFNDYIELVKQTQEDTVEIGKTVRATVKDGHDILKDVAAKKTTAEREFEESEKLKKIYEEKQKKAEEVKKIESEIKKGTEKEKTTSDDSTTSTDES